MKPIAAIVFGLFLLSACDVNINCIEGEGAVQEKEFELSVFDGIELDVPGKVEIKQGPQNVLVRAYDNYWEPLELSVRRGVLVIGSQGCFSDKIEAVITIPSIEYLEINGSGEIFSDNLSAEELELGINGSGDIDINAAVRELDVNINGSGNVKLKGNTQEMGLDINGSGNLNAFEMEVLRADVEISGSGDAKVNVFNELNVSIVGSGDVRYKGQPNIKSNITGSGDVVNAN